MGLDSMALGREQLQGRAGQDLKIPSRARVTSQARGAHAAMLAMHPAEPTKITPPGVAPSAIKTESLKIPAFNLKDFGVVPERGPRPFRKSQRTGAVPKIPLIPAGKKPLISEPFNFIHRKHIAPEDVPSVFSRQAVLKADDPGKLEPKRKARRQAPTPPQQRHGGSPRDSGSDYGRASEEEDDSPPTRDPPALPSAAGNAADTKSRKAGVRFNGERVSVIPDPVYDSDATNSDDDFFGFKDGDGFESPTFESVHEAAAVSSGVAKLKPAAKRPAGTGGYVGGASTAEERMALASEARQRSRAAINAIVTSSSGSDDDDEAIMGFEVHHSASGSHFNPGLRC